MDIQIGIDPGVNNTGIAIFENRVLKIIELAKRRFDDLAMNLAHQTSFVFRALKRVGITTDANVIIAIEVPQIYKRQNYRHQDIIDLAFMTGGLTTAAFSAFHDCHYLEIKIFHPREWKGQVPKKKHNDRVMHKVRGLQEKLGLYKRADREHLIDAAGIALYAMPPAGEVESR